MEAKGRIDSDFERKRMQIAEQEMFEGKRIIEFLKTGCVSGGEREQRSFGYKEFQNEKNGN